MIMEKPFKVNKAANVRNLDDIRFPVVASPKIDGIRFYVKDGVAYSLSNLPLRNKNVQAFVNKHSEFLNDCDGEIFAGSPLDMNLFRNTSSVIMSADRTDNFHMTVFDKIDMPETEYIVRFQTLIDDKIEYEKTLLGNYNEYRDFTETVNVIHTTLIRTMEELLEYEEDTISIGYEGVIVRSLTALYKQGRSTIKEQGIMKIKRFEDAEAVIIGMIEQTTNTNTPIVAESGYLKRSSSKDGLVLNDTLGKLLCRDIHGNRFTISSGLTDAERKDIWENQSEYVGKYIKFKYFNVGNYVGYRHPVFLGFRHEDDIDNKF